MVPVFLGSIQVLPWLTYDVMVLLRSCQVLLDMEVSLPAVYTAQNTDREGAAEA
jgi:hypothetical protein